MVLYKRVLYNIPGMLNNTLLYNITCYITQVDAVYCSWYVHAVLCNICECYITPLVLHKYLNSYITGYILCCITSFATCAFQSSALSSWIQQSGTPCLHLLLDLIGFPGRILFFSVVQLWLGTLTGWAPVSAAQSHTAISAPTRLRKSAIILNSTKKSYQRNNSAEKSSRVHWHQQLYGP
jgi:hypothetical protein